MRRLTGLLLIVRAFAPLLMVLTIYWGYTQVAASFRAAMAPAQAIEQEIAALGAAIENARGYFDTARVNAEAAIATIQNFSVPNLLPNLTASLTIPSLSIPSVTVPIVPTLNVVWSSATGSVSRTIDGACRTVFDFFGIGSLVCDPVKTVTESLSFQYPSNLQFGTTNYTINFPNIPSFTIPTPPFFGTIASQLEGVFSAFDGIFGIFDETLTRFNTLGLNVRAIPERISAIGDAGQQMINNLSAVVSARAGLVSAALLATAVLLFIYFSAGFIRDVVRGLRLLFGG